MPTHQLFSLRHWWTVIHKSLRWRRRTLCAVQPSVHGKNISTERKGWAGHTPDGHLLVGPQALCCSRPSPSHTFFFSSALNFFKHFFFLLTDDSRRSNRQNIQHRHRCPAGLGQRTDFHFGPQRHRRSGRAGNRQKKTRSATTFAGHEVAQRRTGPGNGHAGRHPTGRFASKFFLFTFIYFSAGHCVIQSNCLQNKKEWLDNLHLRLKQACSGAPTPPSPAPVPAPAIAVRPPRPGRVAALAVAASAQVKRGASVNHPTAVPSPSATTSPQPGASGPELLASSSSNPLRWAHFSFSLCHAHTLSSTAPITIIRWKYM